MPRAIVSKTRVREAARRQAGAGGTTHRGGTVGLLKAQTRGRQRVHVGGAEVRVICTAHCGGRLLVCNDEEDIGSVHEDLFLWHKAALYVCRWEFGCKSESGSVCKAGWFSA